MPYWIHRYITAWVAGYLLLFTVPVMAANPSNYSLDYSRLVKFIQDQNLESPLLLLNDSQGEFDQRLNKENIAYLNHNQGLLEQIQARLAANRLSWKLAGSSKRLLVVAERRIEYADLFEQYCKGAVAYVLKRTELPNPYRNITTLQEPVRLPDTPAAEGVTAYLVHNIADEYIEEYLFFNEEDTGTKIKIKLSNRVFTGRIGSYSSKLTIDENSTVEFVREPYTLWQNSAKNPVNVLVAPVEETLHIALRPATETAIRAKVALVRPKTVEEVQQVVDEWIAVEEAIVGGLVAQLMPEVFSHLLSEGLQNKMTDSLAERDAHEQYRYLKQGIRVVTDLGVRPAIALYTSEPQRFKHLVATPNVAAVNFSQPF